MVKRLSVTGWACELADDNTPGETRPFAGVVYLASDYEFLEKRLEDLKNDSNRYMDVSYKRAERIKKLEFEVAQLKDNKLSPICYEDGCNRTALYCDHHASQSDGGDGA